MIVSLAAGSTPDSSFSLIGSIQTMTGFIVQVATGDATYGSDIYYDICGWFHIVLIHIYYNIISQWVTKRFRGVLICKYKFSRSINSSQKLPTRLMKNKVIKVYFPNLYTNRFSRIAILLFDIFRKGMTHLNWISLLISHLRHQAVQVLRCVSGTLWLY